MLNGCEGRYPFLLVVLMVTRLPPYPVSSMNLVTFSIKTKGTHNFARRLWTVFTRFGFSEAQTRRALHTVVHTLRQYNAAPTFFIPAVVLDRHPALLAEIADNGAEIGI